ncbi:MAG: hypothetical protein ACW981_19995 [Candidatus Hodarchaeales archaeon]|jgi:hypothetical protein
MNSKVENNENYLLKCQICDYTMKIPFHCGKQMEISDKSLVCWKGIHAPCCNRDSVIDIPYHHEKEMIKINKEVLYV